MTWNPWTALRDLPNVTIRLTAVEPPNVGLLLYRDDGRAEIHIDRRLGRRSRKAVLAHELVHLERGPVAPWRREREEELVDQEVARRLVPPGDLAAFIVERASLGESVTVEDIGEEFDVPRWVARHARSPAGLRVG